MEQGGGGSFPFFGSGEPYEKIKTLTGISHPQFGSPKM
jgi:hypothetical protein